MKRKVCGICASPRLHSLGQKDWSGTVICENCGARWWKEWRTAKIWEEWINEEETK